MSTLSRGYIWWLLGILVASGQASAPSETELRIAAWSSGGERVQKIWAVVSSLDGKDRYNGNGRDVKLVVPTGQYVLVVEAPGFESKQQIFRAYQPVVFLSAMLPITWVHGQTRSKLSGKVVGYKGDLSNIRVRLVPLYGSEVLEAVPDREGQISFPADSGMYVLLTIVFKAHGAKVADWREVRVGGFETVTINLSRYRD